MKGGHSQNFDVEVVFDRTNATYKPEETVTGQIKLHHKSGNTFKIDVASLTITPKGNLTIQPRHNNKRVEQASKSLNEITMIKAEAIELAKNKTLYFYVLTQELNQLSFLQI